MIAGHNSIEAGQLKAFVERIERVEVEIKGLNDDKKDIYAEARGVGYDTKIVKRVIALRRQDPDKRREEAEIIDLYLAAVEGAP